MNPPYNNTGYIYYIATYLSKILTEHMTFNAIQNAVKPLH